MSLAIFELVIYGHTCIYAYHLGWGGGKPSGPMGSMLWKVCIFKKIDFSEVWSGNLNCFTLRTVVCLFLQVSVDHGVLWNSCLIITASGGAV